MKRFLRKLRGVLGTGLTWGVLWAAIGLAVGLIIGVADPDSIDPGEEPVVIAGFVGIVGFVSGVTFGTILSIAEGRKSILDLSLSRAALWGILGSAVLPLVAGKIDQLIITCPLGALFAMGSVAIARRAQLHDTHASKLLTDSSR
jgi:fucose permease